MLHYSNVPACCDFSQRGHILKLLTSTPAKQRGKFYVWAGGILPVNISTKTELWLIHTAWELGEERDQE